MEESLSRSMVEGALPREDDGREIEARVSRSLAGVDGGKPEELRATVRRLLEEESARLAEQVQGGASGLRVAQNRGHFYSALLQELWLRAGGDNAGPNLVMGAVGGFGREEMSPASDLDLVFIREGSQRELAEEVVKKVLYILWDLGCKVGHACRTIEETIERSESEPMIKTSLLDARYLAGSKPLWDKFCAEYKRRSLEHHVENYLAWRLENQESRHTKEGGTVFVQ